MTKLYRKRYKYWLITAPTIKIVDVIQSMIEYVPDKYLYPAEILVTGTKGTQSGSCLNLVIVERGYLDRYKFVDVASGLVHEFVHVRQEKEKRTHVSEKKLEKEALGAQLKFLEEVKAPQNIIKHYSSQKDWWRKGSKDYVGNQNILQRYMDKYHKHKLRIQLLREGDS